MNNKKITSAIGAILLFFSHLVVGEPSAVDRFGWDNRYLNYDNRQQYLVGFDLQQLHSDLQIDYRAAIDFLAQHELNRFRIWIYTPWFGTDNGGENVLHPWLVVPFGENRRFDLEQWDPAFWNRLRDVVAYAQSHGIVVEITLFSVQEATSYFLDGDEREYAFRATENVQGFGQPGADGDFYPEFFDVDYEEGGKKLSDYQLALIDKTLDELESFDNVYFELVNEAPGPWLHFADSEYLDWAARMSAHIKARSDRLVTAHAHGYADPTEVKNGELSAQAIHEYVQSVASIPNIDGLNFHWYSGDAKEVSDYLNPHQDLGLILSNNEGGLYFRVDNEAVPRASIRSSARLEKERRHSWGHLMAGGYYLAYQGPVELFGDAITAEMAQSLRAMRSIVETIPNWYLLRPTRPDGTEFDTDIQLGPSSPGQVIADPGNAYLLYFTGTPSDNPLVMDLPAGSYDYVWYDITQPNTVLAAGSMEGVPDAIVVPPGVDEWSGQSGLALTLIRQELQGVSTPVIDPDGGTFSSPPAVTITGDHNASIRYTTDGSTPDVTSTLYTEPFVLTETSTVRAIALSEDSIESDVAVATFQLPLPVVAAPSIQPDGGSFTDPVTVTIEGTIGTALYYTTDGTVPDANSSRYAEPLVLAGTATVRAIARLDGYSDSPVTSAAFQIPPPTVPTPVIEPAGGTHTDSVTVTLSTGSGADTIHYTTNGSTPTAASPVYGGGFTLTGSATVKAIGLRSGYAASAVASASFTVTPATGGGGGSGEYQQAADGLVSIELENHDNTTSASGHSWNGVSRSGASGTAVQSLPNNSTNINSGYASSSPRMDYAVNFTRSGTHYVWIRGQGPSNKDDSLHVGLNGAAVSTADRISNFSAAWTWSKGTMDGAVAQINIPSAGVHTINVWMREDGMIGDKLVLTPNTGYTPTGAGPAESSRGQAVPVVQTPVITPTGGSYTDSVTVTLSTGSGADTIRYTIDGSTPTGASPVYGGGFTLTGSATVKAIGLRSGYAASAVASASFTVTPATGGGGGSGEYQQAADGLVSIELENHDNTTSASGHSWNGVSRSGASGTAVQSLPNNSTSINSGYASSSPRMDYAVNFTRSGTHYVWIRGQGPSNKDDSLHVGLNGAAVSTADRISNFSAAWTWSKGTMDGAVAQINIPSAGVHTINVWMREDGMIGDKLVLTPNTGYTPTGAGPAESSRGQAVPVVQTPVITPAGGSYTDSVTVTLSTGSGADTIRYTIDGSTPTGASPVYGGGFTLTGSATVKAIGLRSGYAASAVASDSFTVTPATGGGGGSGEYQQAADGLVSIELENHDNTTSASGHSWNGVSRSGASGTAVQSLPNNSTNINSGYASSSPRMDYAVNFTRSGTHYVWIRGQGPSNKDDSLHVGLNGAAVSTADRISNFSAAWTWSKGTMDGAVAQINIPSAGVHTINVWMREDGMIGDKLVLTPSSAYVPTSTGPAESPPSVPN